MDRAHECCLEAGGPQVPLLMVSLKCVIVRLGWRVIAESKVWNGTDLSVALSLSATNCSSHTCTPPPPPQPPILANPLCFVGMYLL